MERATDLVPLWTFCPSHVYKVKLQNRTIKQVVNILKKFYPRINAIRIMFEEQSESRDIQASPENTQNEKNDDVAIERRKGYVYRIPKIIKSKIDEQIN